MASSRERQSSAKLEARQVVKEGDVVGVFSQHGNGWFAGKVTKVCQDNFVLAEYKVDEDWCRKTMHVNSDHLKMAGLELHEHDPGVPRMRPSPQMRQPKHLRGVTFEPPVC
mmetsp:Transcript_108077/g.187519  ORF Transcript_108077/g.187519 Transcript_108077/m.187519 type:complete len:111 (-) Transcript_108077:25-357(-)